jgi:hypothetical protein
MNILINICILYITRTHFIQEIFCFLFVCYFVCFFFEGGEIYDSDSSRHRSQVICLHISQTVLKIFINISLIIKECPEEILIKLAIVVKISKSS